MRKIRKNGTKVLDDKLYREKLAWGYIPKLYFESQLRHAEKDLASSQRNNSTVYQIAAKKLLIDEIRKNIRYVELNNKRAYKKKYEESLDRVIKRAQQGDIISIGKLIKWDLSWLFVDWIKTRILIAAGIDNRELLDAIGDAVKSRKHKGKTVHDAFLREMKYLRVLGFNFNDPKKVKELREQLFDLDKLGEMNPLYPLLIDQNYFDKFLKRHKLKNGH